jgi:hypothetical protein
MILDWKWANERFWNKPFPRYTCSNKNMISLE